MADGSVAGFTQDRFAAVRDGFAANLQNSIDLGASFAATLDGETVVDLWGGWADEARTRPWERDTIVNVYSTTKTMTPSPPCCWLIAASWISTPPWPVTGPSSPKAGNRK